MKKILIITSLLFLSFSLFSQGFVTSFGLNLKNQYSETVSSPGYDKWAIEAELSGELDYIIGPAFTLGLDLAFSGGICPKESIKDFSTPMLGINVAPLAGLTLIHELFVFQLEAMPVQIHTNFILPSESVGYKNHTVLHFKSGGQINVFKGKKNLDHGLQIGANILTGGFSDGVYFKDFNGFELYIGYRMFIPINQ